MDIVATICSRQKDPKKGLLPATKRYTGEHIMQVHAIAQTLHLPFYVVSGRYGLCRADDDLPHYDYRLRPEHKQMLSELIADQIEVQNITRLRLYVEQKLSWVPYISAVEIACAGRAVFETQLIKNTAN
ncbi:MAG: hypothetical protein JWO43_505 [Candidatus Adlerbacteria bacterium]|nr:hypothetical protein [Candidatus Adlerbacteria bacterium]